MAAEQAGAARRERSSRLADRILEEQTSFMDIAKAICGEAGLNLQPEPEPEMGVGSGGDAGLGAAGAELAAAQAELYAALAQAEHAAGREAQRQADLAMRRTLSRSYFSLLPAAQAGAGGRSGPPTPLQAAQLRLAFALGLRCGLPGDVTDIDVASTVGQRVFGVAQGEAWAPALSFDGLRFDENNARVTQPGQPLSHAVAGVSVPRHDPLGFALAVEVESLPNTHDWFAFGVGRKLASAHEIFGWAEGTCGIW